jgi:hypothetical protein
LGRYNWLAGWSEVVCVYFGPGSVVRFIHEQVVVSEEHNVN